MGPRKRSRRGSSPASSVDLTVVASTASSPPRAEVEENRSKKAKFEQRYDTASFSNEEILRMSFITNISRYQH